VDQTVKRFGRIDIAVNNAGTEGVPGLVTDQTMLPQGSGSIVNVSSAMEASALPEHPFM
jgi:short-subunit dehydrogenase